MIIPSPVKTSKGWSIDIRPQGKYGPRIRRTFTKKMVAEKFIFDEFSKAQSGSYEPPVKNADRLESLIQQWFDLYGHTLISGEKRAQNLHAICRRLKNPKINDITPKMWVEYRNIRLKQKTSVGTTLTPNAINHEQAYLSAIFGTLIKLGVFNGSNPLAGVPKLVIGESNVTYLTLDEIRSLLHACEESESQDLAIRVKLCLATGARWGEVETLQAQQVRDGKVHFEKTKNSTARSMPIDKDIEKELTEGRPKRGRLFQHKSLTAFEYALDRANIQLPRGQKTHVLRHSYATHYMIANGNILHLQKMLGHKTLAMTMTYAKFSPSYLEDAITRNPLAQLKNVHKLSTQIESVHILSS